MLALPFVLAGAYFVLGFIARRHLVNKDDFWGAWWWPISKSDYNDTGQKICIWGRVILLGMAISLLLYYRDF